MNKLKPLLGVVVVAVSLIILARQLYGNWAELPQISSLHITPFGIAGLLILLSLAYPLNGLSWHLITKIFGSDIKFKDNFRVWMISNLSRYIPGGVWQYFGRAYLMTDLGATKKKSIKYLVTEVGFSLVSGLSIITVFWLAVPFCSFIFFLVWRAKFKLVLLTYFAFVGQFAIGGGIIFLLTRFVSNVPLINLYESIRVFTTGWLAGFIIPFAPAGLGVQELALTNLLVTHVPISVAAIISICLRLSYLLAELGTLAFVTYAHLHPHTHLPKISR